jgi:hypothetical protein
MAASDTYEDRFVTLRNGPVVPAAAYLLLLDLVERRNFRLAREDTTLIVRPPERLTPEDRVAIRRWKPHLMMLLNYCAQPSHDAHLFRDDAPTIPAGPPAGQARRSA